MHNAAPPAKRTRTSGSREDDAHWLTADDVQGIFNSFAAMRQEGSFCDAVVVVEEEHFKVHRVVLASSDFLRALFASPMDSSTTTREHGLPTFVLREVAAPAFAVCLEFMYTQTVKVTPATLALVMVAASRLEMVVLLKLCGDFLASELTAENSLATWQVAVSIGDRAELAALREACRRTHQALFASISAQADFVSIDESHLRALVSSDALICSEHDVFSAVRRWIDARDPPLRDEQAIDLCTSSEGSNRTVWGMSGLSRSALHPCCLTRLPDSAVRFTLCEPLFLTSTVDPVLTSLAGGRDLLYDVFKYHALPREEKLASGLQVRTRGPPQGVLRHGDDKVSFDFLQEWTCHCDVGYEVNDFDMIGTLRGVPTSAAFVFAGARRPDGQIALGAVGRRDDVLRESPYEDDSSPTHQSYGTWWYLAITDADAADYEGSFGFSRVPQVNLCCADCTRLDDDPHADYRLSWHLDNSSGGGYRAGQVLFVSEGWRKLLYYV
jgi:hypothetical protein